MNLFPRKRFGRKRLGGAPEGVLVDDCDRDILNEYTWRLNCNGYPRTFLRDGKVRREFFLHRVVVERAIGRDLTQQEKVDHANHNPLDNRRENLRVGTVAFNMQNRAGATSSNKTSGYRGVYYEKRYGGKWLAHARIQGKRHHIGYFKSAEEAATAARAFRLAHMPGALS